MRVLRYLVSYAMVTLCLIAGLLVALDRLVMPRLVQLGQERTIPDVVGLDYADAAETLRGAGFRASIKGHEHDAVRPMGSVVRQEPSAGSMAKPSRVVGVFLGAGPATVTVPALGRMGSREALAALEKSGLVPGDIIMTNAPWTAAAGHVLATYPPEGESVQLGREIDLLVAGPEEADCYVVPRFVGRRISDVAADLRTMGVLLGRRTYVRDTGALEGTVFSTDPPAGFRICRGESLSVVVAS